MLLIKVITLLLPLICVSMVDANRRVGTGVRGGNFPSAAARRFLQEEDEEGSTEESMSSASGDSNEGKGGGKSRSADLLGPTQRECSVDEDNDEMKFECKGETENEGIEIEDKIKFKVEIKKGGSLKIKVEYEEEVETEETETETETQYTVVFDRLLEYRKAVSGVADGGSVAVTRSSSSGSAHNQAYEWGVDTVVAEWPLNNWNDFSPLISNGNTFTFEASTLEEMATFAFTITQDAMGEITANKMKIDFLLENYPWDVSADTYVALICHIETEREIEIESDDDDSDDAVDVVISFDDATDTIGFVPFGEYTWAETAEARTLLEDGNNSTMDAAARNVETIHVIATTSPMMEGSDGEEEDSASSVTEIAFSFTGAGQGAASIYWDPEAGVGYKSSSANGAASSAGPTVGSLFAAIGATSASVFVAFLMM